jgi:hypothetical protein
MKKKEMSSIIELDCDEINLVSDDEEPTPPPPPSQVNKQISMAIPVKPKSDEWYDLRATIGGTLAGVIAGFNGFNPPEEAWKEIYSKIHRQKKPPEKFTKKTELDFIHGNTCEPMPLTLFHDDWYITHHPRRTQKIQHPPCYHKPLPDNPNFPHIEYILEFGVSPDGEGEFDDIEIKNPTSMTAWNYSCGYTINPTYFCQCQHTMAVRGRESMFFVGTCYDRFCFPPFKLLAFVIWEVKFDKEFYSEVIYKRAIRMIQGAHNGQIDPPSDLVWYNNHLTWWKEDYYQNLMKKNCVKRHEWKATQLEIEAHNIKATEFRNAHKDDVACSSSSSF